MEKITMNVEGMMCNNCKAHVEKALAQAGGTDIQVSLEDKTAACSYAAPVTADALKAAVVEAGYQVVESEFL